MTIYKTVHGAIFVCWVCDLLIRDLIYWGEWDHTIENAMGNSCNLVVVGERHLPSRLFEVMVRRRGEDTITIRNHL